MLEWTRETTKNIGLCKQEIKCCMSLRSYVEILFKQVVEDISNQFNRTNEQFRSRMEEMRYAKMKLEGLHCGTANQVSNFWIDSISFTVFFFFVSGERFDTKYHKVGEGIGWKRTLRGPVSDETGKSCTTHWNWTVQGQSSGYFDEGVAGTTRYLPKTLPHDRSGKILIGKLSSFCSPLTTMKL